MAPLKPGRRADAVGNRLLGTSDWARNCARQGGELDGLDEVIVETCGFRAQAVLGLAVTGQRNQTHSLEIGNLAYAPCNLISVHLRQTDIQQHDIRMKRLG